MNKAFTRERDEEDDEGDDSGPPVPAKNYITPQGAKRLHDELMDLKNRVRPEITKTVQWAAGNGDRSENADYQYGKKKLREIDRRMRFLSKRLDAAVVVDPLQVKGDQVLFGATVTVRNDQDQVKKYSIVGVDEIDIARGRISWMSPLANALFKAHKGDVVTFKAPGGVSELEIEEVEYLQLE